MLRFGRFAAPYSRTHPTVEVSEIHEDFGWKCLRAAKAACCEKNLGSTVFCASGLKAQHSKHRLEPSAFTRATREARMDRSWG